MLRLDFTSEYAVCHEEVARPVFAGENRFRDTHAALRRSGVDHLAAAEINADVPLGHSGS